MALALLYPDGDKRGKGNKGSTRKLALGANFNLRRLSEAREILRHSRALAMQVREGSFSLKDALAQVEQEQLKLQTAEHKLGRLQAEAPDLAELVQDERMPLDEAYAAFEQRKAKEEAGEANQRETMVRLGEQAFYAVVAWANASFRAGVRERLADPKFCQQMAERLRLSARIPEGDLDAIVPGAKALHAMIVELMEKRHGQ
jgi:hypothetical protein